MPHSPSEANGSPNEGWMTSEGAETFEIDGPYDLTVRPMRERLRKSLEEKGIIPRRPQVPEPPPAAPEQPPS
jgi:hypothetical protein